MKGREKERRAVERMLELASHGDGGALIILGEAGIGKSTLLAHAHAQSDDMRIIEARCFGSDREAAGATLHDLFRPCVSEAEQLPPLQRDAVLAALSLCGPPADPYLLHAAILNLIATLAAEGPILVSVEDVHWIDSMSGDVLAFVARRLRHEPVAFLLTARSTELLPFPADGLDRLSLDSLDESVSREILADVAPTIGHEGGERVIEAAGGNPLAIIEIGRLMRDRPDDRGWFDGHFPVSELLEKAFGEQLTSLTPELRLAALATAAGSDLGITEVRDAFRTLELEDQVEDELIERGLVERSHGSLTFRHPVIRTVVLGSANPDTLRRAHRALGEAADPRTHPDERIWHLALGLDEPDESIAAELEAIGTRARSTSSSAAAGAFLEAARLSTNGDRAMRMIRAAECQFEAGRIDSISSSIAGLSVDDGTVVAGRLHALRARIAAMRGDAAGAATGLMSASRSMHDDDPEGAAAVAVEAVEQWILARDIDAADDAANYAAKISGDRDPTTRLLVGLRSADALAWRGDPAATDLWLATATIADEHPEIMDEPMAAYYITECFMSAGQPRRALKPSRASVDGARRRGMLGILPYLLTYEAQILIALGRLLEAESLTSEALDLAVDLGREVNRAECHGTIALIAALRSQRDVYESNVAAAEALGAQQNFAYGSTARGLMMLSEGDHEGAVRAFGEAARVSQERGSGDALYFFPRIPNLIEACYVAGDDARSRALLDEFREQAERSRRPLALALAERCAGMLADDGDMEMHFESALSWHEKHDLNPIEVGRTELWWGRRLRRLKRRSEARAHLNSARRYLEQSDASLWIAQVEAEATATGDRARRRDPSTASALTAQERQVAGLAGDALSTKEIAERLFLSPKTIESHLTSIYRKLEINSRSALVRKVAEGSIVEGP